MVLAAGLGTRMRPLTMHKPKPLQVVGGRTMLDHALDKLVAEEVERAVVNTFYLADQIEAHVSNRHDIEIIISREDNLLDTGGGIKKALPYFEGEPFFALNADLPWFDGKEPSLGRMKAAWRPEIMDVLLLLMARDKARGFTGDGDFVMNSDGKVWRQDAPKPRPYVLISAQIMKPELFAPIDKNVFSNNEIWNDVELKQKLYGLVHDGTCYHVGTPEDWVTANALLTSGQGWG